MRSEDWMAQSHEGLYDQANQTVHYLTDDVLLRIGIIGPVLKWYRDSFLTGHARFNTVFESWRDLAGRTVARQAALTDAEQAFRKLFRILYMGYLKGNILVSNEDLVNAGLPERRSGKHAPVRKPVTRVVVTVDTSRPGRVRFLFRDEKAAGKAKPHGVHGGELVYGFFALPPTDWEQFANSVIFTRSPGELVFSGKMRGKTLYFAMRWENTRGVKGPWNEIQSVIIP
jgi:hypothetical protein